MNDFFFLFRKIRLASTVSTRKKEIKNELLTHRITTPNIFFLNIFAVEHAGSVGDLFHACCQ